MPGALGTTTYSTDVLNKEKTMPDNNDGAQNSVIVG